jgi:hypothetical protein
VALCEIVFKDRLQNAETAELARREGHGVGNAALDEMDSDEEPKTLVDPKYF